MTPRDDPMVLIVELIQAGMELRTANGMVLFRPRSRMTPELLKRLRARKTAVVELLRGTTVTYGDNRIVPLGDSWSVAPPIRG